MTDKAPAGTPAEPKGGTIIADRYQIDRLIARGGMATVYLAHHVKLNRPVALKILSPPADAEDAASFEERFRLEAETLASLDHSNIVILHDFGELEDGRFFLAMEFVDGPRLSDVLRDGPLEVERALSLNMQVAAALRYAHKRGVVHRDLKPSNLLIKKRDDGSEHVKVVDFGLVKLTEADQSITRAGLILGSPHCMSPEQVKGLEVDHRADVYAVGILLFRTITGQYPFHGPNSAATMIAHLNQPVPTFFTAAPDLVVPEGLEEIVRKCLEKNPADRYQNMQELMNDMATCMNVPPESLRSVSQSHSTIQSAMVTKKRSKTPMLLGVAGIALFGLIGIAVMAALLSGALNDTPEAPPEAVATAEGEGKTEDKQEAKPEEKVEEKVEDKAEDKAGTAEAAPEEKVEEKQEAAPVVKPKPRPQPKPKPKPKPVQETKSPEPAPTKEPAKEEEQPDGYMGLPDDLF